VKRVLLIIILANIMAVYVDSCLLFTLLQNLTELFSTKFLRISTFSFSCSYVRHIIYEHVQHLATSKIVIYKIIDTMTAILPIYLYTPILYISGINKNFTCYLIIRMQFSILQYLCLRLNFCFSVTFIVGDVTVVLLLGD